MAERVDLKVITEKVKKAAEFGTDHKDVIFAASNAVCVIVNTTLIPHIHNSSLAELNASVLTLNAFTSAYLFRRYYREHPLT